MFSLKHKNNNNNINNNHNERNKKQSKQVTRPFSRLVVVIFTVFLLVSCLRLHNKPQQMLAALWQGWVGPSICVQLLLGKLDDDDGDDVVD